MEDQIPRDVMDDRLQRLQARITEHSLAFNRAKIGTRHADPDRAQGPPPGQMIGKSPWLQSVHVETDAQPGRHHRRHPGRRRAQQHEPAPVRQQVAA